MSRFSDPHAPIPAERPAPACCDLAAVNTAAAASVAWRDRLTSREAEIMDRLARGLLYAEIGTELELSTATVKNHLHRIYAKLDVRSRTEAAVKWLTAVPPHPAAPPALPTLGAE